MAPHTAITALILGGVALVDPTARVNAAGSCKTLADKDNTFFTALVQMQLLSDATLSDMAPEQVFAPVDAALPWLSQCVAAIDPLTVVAQAMTSATLPKCLQTLNETVMPEKMTSNVFQMTICPLYNDTIIPCIKEGVVDLAMRALASATGGCCDAFSAKISELFGNNMTRMSDLLLQHVGNVICAKKTSTSTALSTTGTSSTTEYCGASWLSAFGVNEENVDMLAMLNFAQVSTSQVCDAMAGNTFLSTLGAKIKLPLATSGGNVGICFQPMDLLMQHVRDYPIMKSYVMATGAQTPGVPLADLFAPDKCIPGDALIDWLVLPTNPLLTFVGVYDALMTAIVVPSPNTSAPGNYSGRDPYTYTNLTTLLAAGLGSWKGVAKAFCFHLPVGATCSYNNQQVAYPYTEVAPQVSTLATSLAPKSYHLWVSTFVVVLVASGLAATSL